MEAENNCVVAIDIENLEMSLKSKLDQYPASDSTFEMKKAVSSVNTPEHICKIYGNDHYDPIVVSVGPHHHGKHTLQVMERNKWHCLDFILKMNSKKSLDDYLKVTWELLPLARSYYLDERPLTRSHYQDIIKIDNTRFVQMLLIDGCFLLVALLGHEWISNLQSSVMERVFYNQSFPWQHSFVINDLLLVHNQIPFFVLERIYELCSDGSNSNSTLSERIAAFVENLFWDYPKAIKSSNRPKCCHNLLHLCHMYFRPNQTNSSQDVSPNYDGQLLNQWQRATQYEITGVKFEKRYFDGNNPHSLLDVRLIDNLIFIPYLPVDENTTSIFKNLIALEQTSPQFGNDISSYIIFITRMICDVNDVALFVHKGIIGNHFGSEEDVLNIFSELSEVVVLDYNENHYLKCIHQNLEVYYQSRMKWWKGGWLRREFAAIRDWV